MALAGSPIACWDNSTRGLDAATALEFTKSLKISARVSGACHAVAIYQASQAIYDIFDKAIVLYEGRQIYQGPSNLAKRYFEEMGWYCTSQPFLRCACFWMLLTWIRRSTPTNHRRLPDICHESARAEAEDRF